MAKTKLAGAIFLIGVLLVLTIFFVFAGGGNIDIPGLPGLEKDGNKVICTVDLDADVFTGADIVSANCVKTGAECSTKSPFAIFKEKFNLRATVDGKPLDDVNVDLGVLFDERKTVELKGCALKGKTSVKIELFNTETSILEDSRTVPIR